MLYYAFLLYVLPFIVMTVLVEAEWWGWSTVATLGGGVVLSYLHWHEVWSFLQAHLQQTLLGAAAYIVLGIIWSYVRWFFKLISFRNDFRDQAQVYKKRKKLPLNEAIPNNLMVGFYQDLPYDKRYLAKMPKATSNKSRIIAWMSFWPCSIVGYLLRDPIQKLFLAIFEVLKSSYQKMADSILKDAEFQDRSSLPETRREGSSKDDGGE